MNINKQQEFDVFVKKFVADNWALFLAAHKYRNNSNTGRDSCINYIPERNQQTTPDYIGNSPIFTKFLDEFLDAFILIDDLVFNLNGHYSDLDNLKFVDIVNQSEKSNKHSIRYFSRKNLTTRFSKRLLMDVFTAFIDMRDKTMKPIYYHLFAYDDNLLEIRDSTSCPKCDTYVAMMINYTTNTIISHLDTEPCKLPKSTNRVSVSLKSPSGKLVFLNHPSEFFKLQREDKYDLSINTTLGCIAETKFYAKNNIGYFFIGNTVADILQKKGEILTLCYNDEDEKQVSKYKEYKNRGSVCTGVWWYTVLDYDLYIKLCEQHEVDPKSIEHTVVKTNSMQYKVSHSLAAHSNGHHVGVYSKIKY